MQKRKVSGSDNALTPGPLGHQIPAPDHSAAVDVIQTVDVGSKDSEWIEGQARKFPNRKYVVVDPYFKPPRSDEHGKVKVRYGALRDAGVIVMGMNLSDYIDYMMGHGLRTRSFNFDMIDYAPWEMNRDHDEDMPPIIDPLRFYDFEKLFSTAGRVLTPNGKIFVSSECEEALVQIRECAEKHGLKARPITPFPEFPLQHLRTEAMKDIARFRARNQQKKPSSTDILRLEITYGLTKAGGEVKE